MKKNTFYCFLFFLCWSCNTAGTAQAASEHFKKIVWIVFENTNYQEALKQPDFAALTKQGALFTHLSAETHPSQGNYIAMIAGTHFGVNDDGVVRLSGNHLGDLLEKANLDWRVYAEDYPGNCFQGESVKGYYRKHNPFISFNNVAMDARRCQKIVSADQFDLDLTEGKLPAYSMYIPNIKNDGHDTGVNFAGQWMSARWGKYFASPGEVLFVITFDESESLFTNQIYTVLIGAHVIPGAQNIQNISHAALLKMIEDEFNIGNLGQNDARSPQIIGIWR